MTEPTSTYFADRYASDAERARLDALEAAMDPLTLDNLRRLFDRGLRPAKVLEVGAGGGSIARWLATGAEAVVALDINTRFLTDMPANVEVRQADITSDPIEPLGYDLVHARLLLMHVTDPAHVLDRLASAVAPGGVLLVEEWDYCTTKAYLEDHPLSPVVEKVNRALFDLTYGMGIDIWLGRNLPDMVEATGLIDIEHSGTVRILKGTPATTMQKASTTLLRPALTGRGLATDAEIDGWFEALSDPAFRMIDYMTMSVWARRPRL